MTSKTIDYACLGVEACEAFLEGPAAFCRLRRLILSVAAPLHAVQTVMPDKQLELLDSFTPLSEARH
jgi:hypothetical protein